MQKRSGAWAAQDLEVTLVDHLLHGLVRLAVVKRDPFGEAGGRKGACGVRHRGPRHCCQEALLHARGVLARRAGQLAAGCVPHSRRAACCAGPRAGRRLPCRDRTLALSTKCSAPPDVDRAQTARARARRREHGPARGQRTTLRTVPQAAVATARIPLALIVNVV